MSEENKEGSAAPTPAGVRPTFGGRGKKVVRQVNGKKVKAGAKPASNEKASSDDKASSNEKASTDKATETKPAKSLPSVIIKKFLPVYISTSQNAEFICGLCRNSLDEVCNDCLEKGITDPSKCPVAKGICGHQYHSHCISQWTKRNNSCPYQGCPSRWENA